MECCSYYLSYLGVHLNCTFCKASLVSIRSQLYGVKAAVEVGKRAFKAYEKSEWGRDVVGAWGALIFPHPSPLPEGEGVAIDFMVMCN